jgi:hypothetical protein
LYSFENLITAAKIGILFNSLKEFNDLIELTEDNLSFSLLYSNFLAAYLAFSAAYSINEIFTSTSITSSKFFALISGSK